MPFSRTSVLRRLLGTTMICAGLMAIPAHAQTTGQPPATDDPTVLQEITLTAGGDLMTEGTGEYGGGAAETATGLPLSIRETPQSVSVVSEQRIKDQGLSTVMEVLSYSTGVISNNFETDRDDTYARGFWVANYLVDGIKVPTYEGWYSGVSVQSSTATFDHVEILRGSAGLLTGTGEPGAAVSITRKRADSDVAGGSVELRYGSWNRIGGTLDVASPLTGDGRVRGRFIMDVASEESFVDRYTVEKQTYYGTVEADLTPSTRLTFSLEHRNHDPMASTWGGIPAIFSDGSPTNFDRSFSHAPDWAHWSSSLTGLVARVDHEFDNGWTATLNLGATQRKFDAELIYFSGELDRETGLGMTGGAWKGIDRNKLLSLDANFTGPVDLFGRTHTLNFGVHADRDWLKRDWPAQTSGDLPPANFYDYDGSYPRPEWAESNEDWHVNQTMYSAYASGQFELSDRAKLILGGRYSDWSANNFFEGRSGYRSFDHFTPFAGIVYDVSDAWSVYASYTDMFEPQDSRDRNGHYLDPLLGKNEEIGAKGELLDGRLTASFALFRSSQDNFAMVDEGQKVPGTIDDAYYSVDGVEAKGVEMELNGEISEGWNLFVGASATRLRDENGDRFKTNQPNRTLKLFTTYDLKDDLSNWTVGGGLRWQSGVYDNIQNSTGTYRIEQGSYTVFDLMARYDFNEKWSAQLNVNNVFDKNYYTIGWGEIDFGDPRNATLTITSRF